MVFSLISAHLWENVSSAVDATIIFSIDTTGACLDICGKPCGSAKAVFLFSPQRKTA
jgi:hypothetical protein